MRERILDLAAKKRLENSEETACYNNLSALEKLVMQFANCPSGDCAIYSPAEQLILFGFYNRHGFFNAENWNRFVDKYPGDAISLSELLLYLGLRNNISTQEEPTRKNIDIFFQILQLQKAQSAIAWKKIFNGLATQWRIEKNEYEPYVHKTLLRLAFEDMILCRKVADDLRLPVAQQSRRQCTLQ